MNHSDYPSRVNLEIDLEAIRSNFVEITRHVQNGRVMAVLKANAYGLGVLPVARALKKAGAALFGVAELNEALALKEVGVPVQIIGNLLPDEIRPAVENDVICPVNSFERARELSDEGVRARKNVVCEIIVDSGMGRLGLLADSASPEILAMRNLPNLELRGIYSHCSSAFMRHDPYTNFQFENFKRLLRTLESHGMRFADVHMAASDAVNNFGESCREPFTLVRSGINLYGYYDSDVRRAFGLREVLRLTTKLAAVRWLPKGAEIGYGRTYRLSEDMLVGTIAAGYADGLPLALSNRGYVLIRGAYCPVLGRVSMDYTTVSLASIPDAACGDEVVCIGEQGSNSITLNDWAQLKGTHAYELLCSFGSRVRRVYKGE